MKKRNFLASFSHNLFEIGFSKELLYGNRKKFLCDLFQNCVLSRFCPHREDPLKALHIARLRTECAMQLSCNIGLL